MRIYFEKLNAKAQALQAAEIAPWAISLDFCHGENALDVENIRDWYFGFDPSLLHFGSFAAEADYYTVEELASFCRLDGVHLTGGADLKSFAKYSGRLIYESTPTELLATSNADLQLIENHTNFLLMRLDSILDLTDHQFVALLKEIVANDEDGPQLILAGDFGIADWQAILACDLPIAAVALGFKDLTSQVPKLCAEISWRQLD